MNKLTDKHITLLFILSTFLLLAVSYSDKIILSASSKSRFYKYELKANGKVIAIQDNSIGICGNAARTKQDRRKLYHLEKPTRHKGYRWITELHKSDTTYLSIQDAKSGLTIDKYFVTKNMLFLINSDSTAKYLMETYDIPFELVDKKKVYNNQ